MTSILEVEQLDTLSSNASSTLTIGGTNTTTIAFGPNVTTTPSSLANTPAFCAYLSADQTGIPHETFTKINFNTELFDEGGYYDTSNYRWTPPVGKYVIYANLFTYDTDGGTYRMRRGRVVLYKNGSITSNPQLQSGWQENPTAASSEAEMQTFSVHGAVIINQTTATDYYEVFCYIGNDNGDSNNAVGQDGSVFYGYKLIGA